MAPTPQQTQAKKSRQLLTTKASSTSVDSAKKARVQRYLKSLEPQLRETGRNTLLLQGRRASATLQSLLQDLKALQAPHVKLLSKKNDLVAFDHQAGSGGGPQSIEFLLTKNDCSAFALATHNKKRPHHVVFGRTFDGHILDMAELAVLNYSKLGFLLQQQQQQPDTTPVRKKRMGSKPLLLFVGDAWSQVPEFRSLQNLWTDFYRGLVVDQLLASSTTLDHVLVFTVAEAPSRALAPGSSTQQQQQQQPYWIHQRTYHVQLKKNPHGDTSSSTPVPYLQSCGPDVDWMLKRTLWAEPDAYSAARVQPPTGANKKNKSKKKNLSTNLFGETVGRLHLQKQAVDRLQGRKAKALRRVAKEQHQEELQRLEEELDQERQQEEGKQH